MLADLVESGGDARRDRRGQRGFEAMDTDALEAHASTGSSPPTPTSGSASSTATTTRPGSSPGFFVGQVMKATKGQADGKAVTAALQRRAG